MNLHFEKGSWDAGDKLPQLSQLGGLVTTKVSDLKSEKSRNARFLSLVPAARGMQVKL